MKIKNIISKIKNDIHLLELFRGGGISFILKIVGLALGYLFTIVLARTLGAESVGIYSLSLAIVTISSIFARFGFDTTILRLNAEYKSTNRENRLVPLSKFVFKATLVISIIISAIVYFFSDLIASEFFNKISLGNSIRIISFAITPFSLAIIGSSALKGFKQIPKAVIIDYVSKFAFMLIFLILGLLFFDLDDRSIVVLIVFTAWAMFFASVFWYWTEIKKFSSAVYKNISWKSIVKIAFPLILASSALYLKGWIDTISIGAFMTKKDVGIYNIAYKLANLTIIPLVTINAIAAPKFAENIKNKKDLKAVLRKTIKLIFLFATPILIGLILFSNIALSVFGVEFIKAGDVLIIISIATYINALFGSLGYLLQMTGHHIVFQNSIIALILLSVVANIYLIPKYGLMGAAFSTIFVNIIWNLILCAFVCRNINLNFNRKVTKELN